MGYCDGNRKSRACNVGHEHSFDLAFVPAIARHVLAVAKFDRAGQLSPLHGCGAWVRCRHGLHGDPRVMRVQNTSARTNSPHPPLVPCSSAGPGPQTATPVRVDLQPKQCRVSLYLQ